MLTGIAQCRLPIVPIVLTNFAIEPVRKACLAAGARFLFDKTTEFGHVLDAVRQLAANSRDNGPMT